MTGTTDEKRRATFSDEFPMKTTYIAVLVIALVSLPGSDRAKGAVSPTSLWNVQSTDERRNAFQSAQPSPDLTPTDVVRIQVEALRQNDVPHLDAGIEIAFRFASPLNKQSTGPLARFRLIARSPPYRPLLNHARAEYGGLRRRNDEAVQPVIVTTPSGQRVGYSFFLSKQSGQRFSGCWMTDGVLRFSVPQKPLPPPQSI